MTNKDYYYNDVRCSEGAWDMMSLLAMAVCNQAETFASDLGDDQSRYLCYVMHIYTEKHFIWGDREV